MPALIMGSVPITETASANSFNTLTRSIGTSFAAAVVGVVLAQMSTDLGGYSIPTEAGFMTGLLIGAGMAMLASVLAMATPTRASIEAHANIMRALPAPATCMGLVSHLAVLVEPHQPLPGRAWQCG